MRGSVAVQARKLGEEQRSSGSWNGGEYRKSGNRRERTVARSRGLRTKSMRGMGEGNSLILSVSLVKKTELTCQDLKEGVIMIRLKR